MIQLKSVQRIMADVQKRDTEWTETYRAGEQTSRSQRERHTTELRVTLLHITQRLGQHFDGDFFVVREEMALASISGIVDERVGVGCDTGDTGEDIAEET